jgi:transcriptional regulator with XRE-family HTH domain
MEASEFPREVGRRIRRKRQMLGWSQGDLARRMAMRQSQLSRLERGEFKHIDLEQLRQLIEVLQTSADFLLARSDDPGAIELPGSPGEGLYAWTAAPRTQ